MCTDDQKFTTVVGPRGRVESFLEVLPESDTRGRHSIHGAWLFELGALSDAFYNSCSPAIGVIEHDEGRSFSIAAELQAEFLVGGRHPSLPDLLFEPGYDFRTTGSSPGPGVSLDPNSVSRIHSTRPVIPPADRASGTRVAVLDTGDQNAAHDMIDFVPRPPNQIPPEDQHGHGTAVSEIIRRVAPSADTYPLRVLGPVSNTGPSYQVLAGLAYALWTGLFDVVNASLTSTTGSLCEHSLGTSVSYIVRICRTQSAAPLPVIVAAAGNTRAKNAGYPAIVPGAIVALALEEDPPASKTFIAATYNSIPPTGAIQQEAFGGSNTDPIGNVSSGGTATPLYGTSFATAAVSAAYIP